MTTVRLANLKLIISLILLLIGVHSHVQAQNSSVLTNQQVIFDQISNLATNSAPQAVKSMQSAVYLPEATDQSLEALRSRLFESGFTVSRDHSNSNQFRVVLDSRNELIRSSRNTYRRNLMGTITLSVYDLEDRLVWSDTAEFQYSDVVSRDQTDHLTTDWPITRFNKVEHRRSDRKLLKWVQPLIISGAVATTVVLLFSVRSQ